MLKKINPTTLPVVIPDSIRNPEKVSRRKILLSIFLLLVFCMPTISHADTLGDIWNRELAMHPTFNPDNQAVCVADDTGKNLFSVNINKQIIPASVSKIYLEDYALSKLGHDHTYKTDILRKGTTLYINGNFDPFFTDGDLKKIILSTNKKLVNKKIEHVVFTNLYFNWSTNQTQSKINLKRFVAQNSLFAKKATVTYRAYAYTGIGERYTFTSPPLGVLFKQTNIFSTNSSSHTIFMQLGGHDAFQKYMKETYGVGEESVSFYTGSGLDDNMTTCALTLRVLKHLHEYLIKNNIRVEDFLVFPGLDGGSMSNRMKNMPDKTKLLVKPGFIYNHETLAGIIKTKDGFVYFGIFVTYPNKKDVHSPRVFIDTFSERLINYVNAVSFDYKQVFYDQDSWTYIQ